MKGIFHRTDCGLLWQCGGEKLLIEGWGPDSLRVRGTIYTNFSREAWALISEKSVAQVEIFHEYATVTNGAISARIQSSGQITFFDAQGTLLLDEYARNIAYANHPMRLDAREYKGLSGGDFRLTMRFDSDPNEKIYGMGQYQQTMLNLKGCVLELAQRNTQASVPFALSNKGYGFLWNNPAIGSVCFGRNLTEWFAASTHQLDYWITAASTPAQLVKNYTQATGRSPMMPEYAMGFWQSKLRYQTQEELLEVAREYKARDIPLSVIVADFYHWPHEGDWKFDERYWPDPAGMVRELKEMGIQLVVSIWPTVEQKSENYEALMQNGYLIRAERGLDWCMDSAANTKFVDVTNPDARLKFWDIVKENYYSQGIRSFWLDVAEPEFLVYDYDNYRYSIGPALQVSNIFPQLYAKTFYDGMLKEGQTEVVSLIRCAWAGSQRYGALAWSGDVHTTFETFRRQLVAGLNMGLAGICWWNTDIGGFQGAHIDDPEFQELLIRWFEYATFTPVMRMHGFRMPEQPPIGIDGGGRCTSGAPNEIWSYGEKAYNIFTRYIRLRESMKPYIRRLMEEAHCNGSPVIRPLFYDHPLDSKCWDVEDQFLFGSAVLVAPILYAGQQRRSVYLPEGYIWLDPHGQKYTGGSTIQVDAPIERIPLLVREDLAQLDGLQGLFQF